MSCCDKNYDYSILWRPIDINKCRIRNRISMSGMGTFTPTMAEQYETESGLRYYEERAKGGIGLIHTGAYFIDEKTAQGGRTLDFSTDKSIPSGTVLTERVHRWGAKIFAQLSCGTGRNGMPQIGERVPISSSENPSFYNPSMICRPLSIEEIEEMMEHWKVAARNAMNMGFDGIQIHAHAGYLMDQFMSEIWNHRKDKYGGSFENRCRFTMETVDAIRSVVGPNFPITYRISLDHRFPGGRTLEESMKILDVLDKCGIDAFDIDAACYETMDYIFPTRYTGEACMAYVCEEARKHLTKPIINTGNHSMESAVDLLKSGNADIVQFGRQSIADPQFANKLREGRREDVRPCIVCNEECIGRIFGRLTQLSCTVNPSVGFESYMEVKPVSGPTNVVVIGGGPGGMYAAEMCAKRGHSVTLLEKATELGGHFLVASYPPGKGEISGAIRSFIVNCREAGVDIRTNTEATPELVASLKPDAIIIATGSVPLRLPIPGLDTCGCSTAEDVLTGKVDTGKRVLVVGGGMVGCECVEFLTEREHIVDMVEMKPVIGEDIVPEARKYIMANLEKHKVTQRVNARVKQFYADGVDYVDTVTGEEASMRGYDSVVLAMGYKSNNTLEEKLKDLAPQVIVIGEARQAPGNSMEATGDALNAALAI